MEHVDVYAGAAAEDVADVFELGRDGAGLVGVTPVIEPAGPVFGDEEGLVGAFAGEGVHASLVVADAEVGGGEETGEITLGDVAPVIGGVKEGGGEAGVFECGFEVGHVGLVGSEVAVLVFDLGHEDGAAVADLEGGDLLPEAMDPAIGWDEEAWVGGAEGGWWDGGAPSICRYRGVCTPLRFGRDDGVLGGREVEGGRPEEWPRSWAGANAGVSPLRSAPVEMTALPCSVEMTRMLVGGWRRRARVLRRGLRDL